MVDFEKSESGLLLPQQIEARERKRSRLAVLANSVGLSTIVNFFMVLIQLATVWILWKTYQDTVIPNRQKELLSEQVAQLELERKSTTEQIALAQERVSSLDKDLGVRQAALNQLTNERQQLLAEATTAQMHAERARLAEISARSSAGKMQMNLEASQWSIYFQSASSIVSLPSMITTRKLGEFERASIGARDSKKAFHEYLDGVESIWPDMKKDVMLVARELRADSSKFYPRWMIEEFSAYFLREGEALSCPKPNFASIRAETDRKFDVAAAAAIAERRKDQAERQASLDEARKRRVEIPYPDSVKQYELSVAVSNATYKMIDEVEDGLTKAIDKCYERFDPIADKFFASKNASQQTIPLGVYRELSNTLQGTEDPSPASSDDAKDGE